MRKIHLTLLAQTVIILSLLGYVIFLRNIINSNDQKLMISNEAFSRLTLEYHFGDITGQNPHRSLISTSTDKDLEKQILTEVSNKGFRLERKASDIYVFNQSGERVAIIGPDKVIKWDAPSQKVEIFK